jgi:hypothetical protein
MAFFSYRPGVSPRRFVRFVIRRLQPAVGVGAETVVAVASLFGDSVFLTPPPARLRGDRASCLRVALRFAPARVRVGVTLQDVPRRHPGFVPDRDVRASPFQKFGEVEVPVRVAVVQRRVSRDVNGVQVRARLDEELADAFAVVLRGDN